MAAASGDEQPLKRSRSFEWLPPDMSELRIVLLGNSWSQKSEVVNFLLGLTSLTGVSPSMNYKAPEYCLRISGTVEDKKIVVTNSPDLLFDNISLEKLNEILKVCAEQSAPGPHVFLLVLQPEDFTEEHKRRLCRVLDNFNHQSFDHSLVLISPPREGGSGFKEKYQQQPHLKDMIRKCRFGDLKQENLERSELLTRFGQIVKENNGEYVSYEAFEDTTPTLPDDPQKPKKTQTPITDAVKAIGLSGATKNTPRLSLSGKNPLSPTSAFRIVLLGKSDDKKTKIGNFITGNKGVLSRFKREVSNGKWKGKPVTVVKTPDMCSLSEEEVKKCVNLCPPGPNVLLLVVNPSDFTEENKQTLKFTLSLFGQDAFNHSMVIITRDTEMSVSVNDLLKECEGRHYSMSEDDHGLLMHQIEQTANKTNETRLPALNLILCGRRGAGKTSVVKAILGQRELDPPADSSECVKHQAGVCGRQVSLVELPSSYGKPQQTVMEESFSCVSLCDPEGVHAFILVIPVGPLTDEDKGELKTIQDTFSSQVKDFSMILFTVESDPTVPAVVDFIKGNRDIQDLCQSCGGKHVVLNIKDEQQIPELLETVEKMNLSEGFPRCYTTKTFTHVQIEKITQLQQKIQEAELEKVKSKMQNTCDEEQSSQTLRIVLIGKTGSGKSSSGNTILGRKEFDAKSSQTSVTKMCKKSKSVVDGRPVVVVDTPGLFDTTMSHDQVNEEMVKCISHLAPGPHVFLLALAIGRLTQEEKETLTLIKKVFGKNSETFTIVLFTRGDTLEHEKRSIDEYIETECDDSFEKLISDCGRRFHVFNNYNTTDRSQVSDLINMIDAMVKKNGGSCYTNEMLQEAEAAIKKEVERILKEKEEEMKREREELERKHREEMEAMQRRMEKQRVDIEQEREQRDKELKEKEGHIKKEREQRMKEQKKRDVEDEKKRQREEIQKKDWEQKLAALEEKIQSESKEKESIDKKLVESREEMRKQRDAWEKERKEEWDERNKESQQNRQMEKRLKELQDEFEQERAQYEKKRKEDDEIRKEQEEKQLKELEGNYKKQMDEMETKHEEEARKQAEEFNEFREKYTKDFEALLKRHEKELNALKQQHEKEMEQTEETHSTQYSLLQDLSSHKEKELKKNLEDEDKLTLALTLTIENEIEHNEQKTKEMEDLKNKHKEEIAALEEKFKEREKNCTIC